LLVAALFLFLFDFGQVVKVTGEVLTPLDLDAAALHQFTQTTVVRKAKTASDIPIPGYLSDILKKAALLWRMH